MSAVIKPSRAVILLAHGSRHASWRHAFEQLADALQQRTSSVRVQMAYLGSSAPNFDDVIDSLASDGASYVTVIPHSLSSWCAIFNSSYIF